MTSRKKAPSMTWALQEALKSAKIRPEDRAALALVRLYCVRLDEASDLAEQARLTAAELDPEDAAGHRRLATLARRVEAHAIAAELGPKLESALTSIGMTLRGGAVRGVNDERQSGATGKLDELRARRAARTR